MEACSLAAVGAAYNLVVVEACSLTAVGAYNPVVVEDSPAVVAGTPTAAECNAVDQAWVLMTEWLPHNWGI